MHAYYQSRDVLPTYGAFKTEADLEKHVTYRRDFLQEKLYLHPRIFNGLRLIEFGCDSGENALVWAVWGAHITLVEPNPKAMPKLYENFHRFKLEGHIQCSIRMTLEDYAKTTFADSRYDLVVAEGMIQTIDRDVWQPLFNKILKPGGLLLISYPEIYGMGMDFLHREIWQAVKAARPEVTARQVFGAKWDLIPHTRSFESWVMDMLENPFVTEEFTFETNALDEQMTNRGFRLYSSWPVRRHVNTAYWHKENRDTTGIQRAYVEQMQVGMSGDYLNIAPFVKNMIARNEIADLIAYCQTNALFLHSWGVPYHFSVYERTL